MDSKPHLNIGFLNIMGQSILSIAKQNQIEFFIKKHNIHILHLQETFIEEHTFQSCNFICDNYQILFINNESKYGVCSLVHRSLTTSNEVFHPSGRILAFDVEDFSFINIYLPSGTDSPTKAAREDLIGEALPNILLHRKHSGLAGGDYNCIVSSLDTTSNHEQKISTNLKKLISIKEWSDTFRHLHPDKKVFSHYYKRTAADGSVSQGGSRLDRSYLWGQRTTISSSYESVAFSDHFAHLVQIPGGPETTPTNEKPNFKPNFKISPEIAEDETFIENVEKIMKNWRKIKETIPLQQWWDGVKKEIKRIAKQRNAEIRKEKKSELNLFMGLQAYYSKKVLQGNKEALGSLKEIQLKIVNWFEEEAEKVKRFAQLEDIEKSEKVRLYHHELHKRVVNKSTIVKLRTPEKDLIGHKECAEYLAEEVRNLWEKEIHLNDEAQEELLQDVEKVFTEEDNKLLEAPISNQEIRESLERCNFKASPGTDSVTYLTYKSCWHILGEDLGDVLREVVQSKKPSKSMQHGFMVFTPKNGKNSPPLPKNLRKISLLNTDFKILSGVYANRLKQMEDHTISNNQFSVKPKKVTHAISLARDTINSVNLGQKGCAIGEFDFQSAFDFLCVEGWTWKILERKGASSAFLSTMKALYTDPEGAGFCIPVINNEKMPRIRNIRKILRQGDKLSSTWFNFSIDGLLIRLEKRLKGILYYSLKTQGPKHPQYGEPKAIESRFKAAGYIDDIKTSICNKEEFHIVDHSLHLFEEASGCRLHRNPSSGKCNILTLGQWARWKQEDVPLNYVRLTDSLNFLGVQLSRNASKTRRINGEILTTTVKTKIASFKAGRFFPLICRPYAANMYVMSKLCYKAAILDLRCKDLRAIQSSIKSWIFQDMLLKPRESILHRDAVDGGMGLLHVQTRCQAVLAKTFVDQGHTAAPCDNLFLKSLYRAHIIEDLDKSCAKRPQYFPASLFAIIKKVHKSLKGNIFNMSTNRWQHFILERGITHITNDNNGEITLIPTPQEEQMTNIDWENSRILRQVRGLPPTNRSLILRWSENLHTNQERLYKLGKAESAKCLLCSDNATDNRQHLWFCNFNSTVNKAALRMIESTTEKACSPNQLCVFDFAIPTQLHLPVMFILSSILDMIIESRQKKKLLDINQTKSTILSRSKIYLDSKKNKEAHLTIKNLLEDFFTGLNRVRTTPTDTGGETP